MTGPESPAVQDTDWLREVAAEALVAFGPAAELMDLDEEDQREYLDQADAVLAAVLPEVADELRRRADRMPLSDPGIMRGVQHAATIVTWLAQTYAVSAPPTPPGSPPADERATAVETGMELQDDGGYEPFVADEHFTEGPTFLTAVWVPADQAAAVPGTGGDPQRSLEPAAPPITNTPVSLQVDPAWTVSVWRCACHNLTWGAAGGRIVTSGRGPMRPFSYPDLTSAEAAHGPLTPLVVDNVPALLAEHATLRTELAKFTAPPGTPTYGQLARSHAELLDQQNEWREAMRSLGEEFGQDTARLEAERDRLAELVGEEGQEGWDGCSRAEAIRQAGIYQKRADNAQVALNQMALDLQARDIAVREADGLREQVEAERDALREHASFCNAEATKLTEAQLQVIDQRDRLAETSARLEVERDDALALVAACTTKQQRRLVETIRKVREIHSPPPGWEREWKDPAKALAQGWPPCAGCATVATFTPIGKCRTRAALGDIPSPTAPEAAPVEPEGTPDSAPHGADAKETTTDG